MPSLVVSWLVLALFPAISHAKGVFAHFMVSNSENFTRDDWATDMAAAKAANIDAFALNAGWGMPYTATALNNAFAVAAELDFKLFLSLDYSGDGYWPKDQVIKWLANYTVLEAYYKHRGEKPLVSTFEGTASAADWTDIKKEVDVFFIPDWTSEGSAKASTRPMVDGLMSWDAWPNGTEVMNTIEDEGYMEDLEGRPYIMPVSPWFYTNLVSYNKNWVWQGDDLWYTRWQQVLDVNPEYVEILTWNDFGESHYIGPLHGHDLGIFYYGGAPFNYALDMPHDGWRALLPYVVQQFKNPQARETVEIEKEMITTWYRLSPAAACKADDTTGNSVSQNQETIAPGEVLQDKIFFSALLDSEADVAVSIGGENRSASWASVPDGGGKGIYHGNLAMDNQTGEVVVTLSRNNRFLAQIHGENISTHCPGNLTNWNAWVGNATSIETRVLDSDSSNKSSSSAAAASLCLSMGDHTTRLIFWLILGLMAWVS